MNTCKLFYQNFKIYDDEQNKQTNKQINKNVKTKNVEKTRSNLCKISHLQQSHFDKNICKILWYSDILHWCGKVRPNTHFDLIKHLIQVRWVKISFPSWIDEDIEDIKWRHQRQNFFLFRYYFTDDLLKIVSIVSSKLNRREAITRKFCLLSTFHVVSCTRKLTKNNSQIISC